MALVRSCVRRPPAAARPAPTSEHTLVYTQGTMPSIAYYRNYGKTFKKPRRPFEKVRQRTRAGRRAELRAGCAVHSVAFMLALTVITAACVTA